MKLTGLKHIVLALPGSLGAAQGPKHRKSKFSVRRFIGPIPERDVPMSPCPPLESHTAKLSPNLPGRVHQQAFAQLLGAHCHNSTNVLQSIRQSINSRIPGRPLPVRGYQDTRLRTVPGPVLLPRRSTGIRRRHVSTDAGA